MPKRQCRSRAAREAQVKAAAGGCGVLTSLTLVDYKSFKEARLPLARLTMLVGANASGKSNALEALQLLSFLAQGRRLHELLVAMRDRDLGVRGGPGDLIRRGATRRSFELRCTVEEGGESVTLRLVVEEVAQGYRILHEELQDPSSPGVLLQLYLVDEPSHPPGIEMQVSYNNFARGGKKPKVVCIDQTPVFLQLQSPAAFRADHRESRRRIPKATAMVRRALENMLFLDPQPSAMRGYAFPGESRPRKDGANVSAVLHRLVEREGRKEEVLAFVRTLPEQDISDIGFIEGGRGEVMVRLTESFGGGQQQVEAALLSDGTLRVLAIASTLLSAPEGALVVVEEIDNGVHPSRAERLIAQVEEVAARRNLRVLITTHNPALLDALPPAAMPDVVAAHRSRQSGVSQLSRLGDLPRYTAIVARGSLGELSASGELERQLGLPAPSAKSALDALLALGAP
jgi:predicted ATPase